MKTQSFYLDPGLPQVRGNCVALIGNLPTDKKFKITISAYKKSRSDEQNAYYWSAILPAIRLHLLDSTGEMYSSDELHEWFRDKLLDHSEVTINGQTVIVRPSTTKLKVGEMSDYIEKVIAVAAGMGCVVPPPTFKGVK
jgi:hypothetical protein